MIEVHTIKEENKYYNERNKFRVVCKCGHTSFIGFQIDYAICDWCGNKVYNKKINFKNNILKAIEKLKDDTFTCKNCNEITEEEHRAEESYERFGEYDLCEWCCEEIKEDMR